MHLRAPTPGSTIRRSRCSARRPSSSTRTSRAGARASSWPLAPSGTPFQQRVWAAIASVPAGETLSYAELARRAGCPGSARAAGAATGRNPLAIVVPCHRIIGSDGSLTGYAGGLERKRALLAHERQFARLATAA